MTKKPPSLKNAYRNSQQKKVYFYLYYYKILSYYNLEIQPTVYLYCILSVKIMLLLLFVSLLDKDH